MERVDTLLLQALLDQDIVPVIPPLGCDGEGNTYRLNSDAVAVEVARALRAVKLIYLSTKEGIRLGDELVRQLSVEEAEEIIKAQKTDGSTAVNSKLEHAVRAARGGVPRVHIIDGRVEEGLLAEVFSNQGIGTLVYANEYQAIRAARSKDSRAIFALIQAGMESDELLRRSLADIERQISDFYVFEVDRNPVACVALHFYSGDAKAELACMCVDPSQENQGIGIKLMQYVENQAPRPAHERFFVFPLRPLITLSRKAATEWARATICRPTAANVTSVAAVGRRFSRKGYRACGVLLQRGRIVAARFATALRTLPGIPRTIGWYWFVFASVYALAGGRSATEETGQENRSHQYSGYSHTCSKRSWKGKEPAISASRLLSRH